MDITRIEFWTAVNKNSDHSHDETRSNCSIDIHTSLLSLWPYLTAPLIVVPHFFDGFPFPFPSPCIFTAPIDIDIWVVRV